MIIDQKGQKEVVKQQKEATKERKQDKKSPLQNFVEN